MSEVEVIRADALSGMRHGFLGRRGGVSRGVCAGLNCGLGSDDDHDDVVENRRRAADSVAPASDLFTILMWFFTGAGAPATVPRSRGHSSAASLGDVRDSASRCTALMALPAASLASSTSVPGATPGSACTVPRHSS